MTKNKALKMALKFIKSGMPIDTYGIDEEQLQTTIKAIRQALAEPEQPVSFYVYEWINPFNGTVFRSFRHDEHHMGREPDRTIAVPAPHTCAAPDLLEALETIAEYWDKDTNHDAMEDACWYAINTAEAAIAKARGE